MDGAGESRVHNVECSKYPGTVLEPCNGTATTEPFQICDVAPTLGFSWRGDFRTAAVVVDIIHLTADQTHQHLSLRYL